MLRDDKICTYLPAVKKLYDNVITAKNTCRGYIKIYTALLS